ncbi:hypothetical protein GQ464_018410 [Rhodocaloribacter litoris]|uniref:hypothetical protein n=1 Tax=Rhodocaloribacter litoris TaxID=2558931 RepID=UPI0014212E71|nr:hypothetical protein [Rhodocaloribacter litoris]QXD15338.1 hypothetical protein GQ464_018410 [Rhodocaloribacter litoris]
MQPPGRDPAEVPAGALVDVPPADPLFEGFGPAAFAALARLKAEPHIERYRVEKEALRRYVQAPFRRLRDDLAVRWVLPNALALETERNVFSRFLKNDFGAGGCHAHYWMAFYRVGRRRLADVQLIVSLHADGLKVGVYAGEPARAVWKAVRAHLPGTEGASWRAGVPLLQTQKSVWAGERLPREAVLALGPRLTGEVVRVWHRCWPFYRFCCTVTRAAGAG